MGISNCTSGYLIDCLKEGKTLHLKKEDDKGSEKISVIIVTKKSDNIYNVKAWNNNVTIDDIILNIFSNPNKWFVE